MNYLNLLNDNYSKVDKVFSEIEKKDKVIFYFHGGLSPKNYVKRRLGPYLLETMLSSEQLDTDNLKAHVVFMEYNTAIFQKKYIKNKVDKLIKKNRWKLLTTFITKESVLFFDFYEKQLLDKNINISDAVFFENQLENYANKHLLENFKKFTNKNGVSVLDTFPKVGFALSKIKSITFYLIKKWLILKIKNLGLITVFKNYVSRVYYKTDHGRIIEDYELTTIVEEVLKLTIVKKIAQNHWEKVYCNGKYMWETNTGNYFLKKLISHYLDRLHTSKPLVIDLLSHSAGSIPIAYLVNNLKNYNHIINNILMIVPAIRIGLFEKLIFKNDTIFNKLKIYLLDDYSEKKDTLFPSYHGSLLYFVSGVAEVDESKSDMTILGMHRYFKDIYPYNNYNSSTSLFGNVQLCKEYLTQPSKHRMVFVSKKDIIDDDFGMKVIKTPGATHSKTKLPHKCPELATNIISYLTLKSNIYLSSDTYRFWNESSFNYDLD